MSCHDNIKICFRTYIKINILFCGPGACESPPVMEAIYSLASRTRNEFPVGAEVEYTCKTGFFFREGGSKATCVKNGDAESWEGPTLKCSRKCD